MQDLDHQLIGVLNIVISAMLAAIPGIDRELRHRPAGLRTHIMVGVSSTLMATAAQITFSADSAARLAAGIITGVGFLGAGVIVQRKTHVHELTTASSIWYVALMGIVVAYELYVLALGSTLIVAFVLTILRRVERNILNKHTPQEPKEPSEHVNE